MERTTLVGHREASRHPAWAALLLSLLVVGCDSTSGPGTIGKDATSEPRAVSDEFQLIDAVREVPELSSYRHSGPNDVRDVLVRNREFFVATGKGIARYNSDDDGARIVAEYSASCGLPSDNAFVLQEDADGGVWALCEGGVGLLEEDSGEWVAYTDENGLAAGSVTSLAISQEGRRVWVTSSGGLATAAIHDRQWKSYPVKNPIDILVAPDGTRAWCRRLLASNCMCGRHVLTSQIDLATATWLDVPDSGNCAHVAPKPAHYCDQTNRLWLSGGYAPPLLYDPTTGTMRTWPAEPNWERIEDVNTVVYSDWFGQMLEFADDSGRMWFSTNAGLWSYDPENDEWEIRRLRDDPGCGEPLLVRTRDSKTIYWECEGIVAAFDITDQQWTELWSPEDASYGDQLPQLVLSPDEKYLWWANPDGIVVGNLQTRDSVRLTDGTSPGLGRPRVLRFDPAAERALVGTPRGVVICDYAGKVLATTSRSSCPISYEVTRFVFAPDGSEVWCLQMDPSGFTQPAVVLHPLEQQWEEVPDPKTEGRFYDVAFSKDGKTTWLSMERYGEGTHSLQERTKDDRRWVPIRIRMPKYHSRITRFWLSPSGDELWLNNDGSGLLRIKLATEEVSQYVKRDYRRERVEKHFPLVEDFVKDLVFTSDGRYAICSATGGADGGITLIDLQTGDPQSFPTEGGVWEMSLSADQKTVSCSLGFAEQPSVFDIEHREWVTNEGQVPNSTAVAAEAADVHGLYDSLGAVAAEAGLAVISVAEPVDDRYVACVLATRERRSSVEWFDGKLGCLTKVKDIGSAEVTALQLGPNDIVWAALPGCIVSIDPRTGKMSEFD